MSEYVALPQDPFEIRPYSEYQLIKKFPKYFYFYKDEDENIVYINTLESTIGFYNPETDDKILEDEKPFDPSFRCSITRKINKWNCNERRLLRDAERLAKIYEGDYINCLLI